MRKVTIDERTRLRLFGCLDEVELCDESGQTLARLTPDPEYRRKTYERLMAEVSDEEVERARQEPEEYTFAEVMERLQPSCDTSSGGESPLGTSSPTNGLTPPTGTR